MPNATDAADLTDQELVLRFESLGDNCELGLVQRRVGAEPLGLFRFAGAPLHHLLRGLAQRFAGMTDPDKVEVRLTNDEYMIHLLKYDYNYHAHIKAGEVDPDRLHRQQVRTLGFLIAKFLGDLENGEKILVFRQNEELSANDLFDLRQAIAACGPGILLWVQAARPGYPAGTVIQADDRLLIGYVTKLAPRHHVPDVDVRSWMEVLRKAYGMVVRRHSDVPARLRVDLTFGRNGNAASAAGEGWSGHEDGFTWAIDDRSYVTLQVPDGNGDAWLEFDVVPFVWPPVLAGQPMGVWIDGTLVHSFAELDRGINGCAVPARFLEQRETIEIVLDHPNAATPRSVRGENDDRRLAVSFYRISLMRGEAPGR